MITETLRAAPKAGEIAPDFTLPSTAGKPITLSDFRGQHHVLLAFFPLAFSSTCTAELCDMRDAYDQFASADVTVLPISVDSTYSLKEYKAKYNMQVEMLSDFKREISILYGVFMPERFYSNRAYFLIDKAGVIRWAHVEENPSHRRDNATILSEIARLA